MQDRHPTRSTKPLATHGRTIHWVIHVIPTIPACPVRHKSGHSVLARQGKFLAGADKTGVRLKSIDAGPRVNRIPARGNTDYHTLKAHRFGTFPGNRVSVPFLGW
jgi:hypothetical protein